MASKIFFLTQFLLNLVLFCILFNLWASVHSKPQNEEPLTNGTAEEVKKDGEIVRDDWDPNCGYECHHHHGHPRPGSEAFHYYLDVFTNCLEYNGLLPDTREAIRRCKGDRRAERNVDCFALCVYIEEGLLSPVRISSEKYYIENYDRYMQHFNLAFNEDRLTQGDAITTLLSCKSRMNRPHSWYDTVTYPPPPHFLFPDLNNCDALNGVFRCGYHRFFKLHNCIYKREDADFNEEEGPQ